MINKKWEEIMKKKRRQRVLAVVMATLMIVGLIPTSFAVKVANATIVKTVVDLSAGFLKTGSYGGNANITVMADLAYTSGATTIGGQACTGYVTSSSANPVVSSGGAVPTDGAVVKISPTENCKFKVAFKVNNGKSFYFLSTENIATPVETFTNSTGASAYYYKEYDLKANYTYYMYNYSSTKIAVYYMEIDTGTADLDWSTVAAPQLTGASQADSKINVNYTGVIGDLGADGITVDMYNGSTLVATQISKTVGTSGTVSFSPTATGTYTFKARLTRSGQTDKLAAADASCGYLAPLTAASISSLTSLGGGSLSVAWTAVNEATSYLVSYSTDGTNFSTAQEVTDTQATLTGLTIGTSYTFKVVAKRGADLSPAATKVETVSADVQKVWNYSVFGGSSISTTDDFYTGNVYHNDLRLVTNNGKGKLVTGIDSDQIGFYYTKIDSNLNFTLTAKVHINSMTLNGGQDGFGLMVADTVGINGDTTPFYDNTVSTMVGKVEYYYDNINDVVTGTSLTSSGTNKISMTNGVGARLKAGYTSTSSSTNGTWAIKPLDMSCKTLDNIKPFNVIGGGTNTNLTTINNQGSLYTDLTLTLTRDNTGYRCSWVNPNGEVVKQTFYDFNNEKLSALDKANDYVGFFTSRNGDISISNVSFTTISRSSDAPAEAAEITYVNPIDTVTSPTATGIADYKLAFNANADGVLTVKDPSGNIILDSVSVAARTNILAPVVTLKKGSNNFTVTFKPTANYSPGEYQALSSYDEVTINQVVNYKTYGTTGQSLWVSPTGTSSASGNVNDPMDIFTAVKYVQPGQTIVLKEGTYNIDTAVTVARGIDGTAENPITMMVDPAASSRPVFDFGKVGSGMTFSGNYWYIQGFDVTNTVDKLKGIQISGSNCTLDHVNAYHNGNSGIQLCRLLATDAWQDWPANNLILNCTSYGNADASYADADGFAAKLTIAGGNVFRGCIAYNNADDGWDLFAKVDTGSIGQVVIENCVSYNNGYLEDGTNAGNGNGFKLGGSGLSGLHKLINCVSYNNKAKGIDSNSCPDIIVQNCTSYNNGLGSTATDKATNVAMYTSSSVKNTSYDASGIISFKSGASDLVLSIADSANIKPLGTQDLTKINNATNYYWDGVGKSVNSLNVAVSADWFVSLDTTVIPTRMVDGSIDMHGLLMLTDRAPADAGARFVATPSRVSIVPTSVPKTGDSTHIYLFYTLSIMSGAALVGLYFFNRKRKSA